MRFSWRNTLVIYGYMYIYAFFAFLELTLLYNSPYEVLWSVLLVCNILCFFLHGYEFDYSPAVFKILSKYMTTQTNFCERMLRSCDRFETYYSIYLLCVKFRDLKTEIYHVGGLLYVLEC